VLTARSFAKHGDRLALRRLKFILPFQLIAALLLVLGIRAMKIPDPSEILIPGAIAFGAVGALLSLMLHAIDRQ
jgi:predicted Abi (CAAX) family protease